MGKIIYNPPIFKAIKKRSYKLSCNEMFSCSEILKRHFARCKNNELYRGAQKLCMSRRYTENLFYNTKDDKWRTSHDTEDTKDELVDKPLRKSEEPGYAQMNIESHFEEFCERMEGNIYVIGKEATDAIEEMARHYEKELAEVDDVERYTVENFEQDPVSIILQHYEISVNDNGERCSLQDNTIIDIPEEREADYLFGYSDGKLRAAFKGSKDPKYGTYSKDHSDKIEDENFIKYVSMVAAILAMREYLQSYCKIVKPGEMLFRDGMNTVWNGTGLVLKYCK